MRPAIAGRHARLNGQQLEVAGIAERNSIPFRFVTYMLYGMPMMIVSIAISHLYVWWRYF